MMMIMFENGKKNHMKYMMKMATLKTSGLQPVAHLTMAYMSQAALLLELWAGVALMIMVMVMIMTKTRMIMRTIIIMMKRIMMMTI